MTVFNEYADYYDCLYDDKDYAGESAVIEKIIRERMSNAKSILDLGCGTGRYSVEFAKRGFTVDGVDISPKMLKHAEARLKNEPKHVQERVRLEEGDASNYRSRQKYDVVLALFHVLCYQTSAHALRGMFETVREALQPNGISIIDFWYGPAVLHLKPEIRVRRYARPGLQLTRIAEPTLESRRNEVNVKYTLFVMEQTPERVHQIAELHTIRYLFLPELELLCSAVGLK